MKASAHTDGTDKVLTLMFEMGRLIRHACIGAGDLPLPLAHLETLRFVGEKKSPTMRDVATYLRITAPSATHIIDELVKGGLMTRSADRKDRRIVRLTLSKKGSTFLAKSMRLKMKVLRGIVGSLNRADQKEFVRILSKLIHV
jgi:DNA-binding MarR family transcriptional regulator